MRSVLVDLRINLRDVLQKQKEEIGYNLAALQYIRQQYESQRTAQFHEEGDVDETKAELNLLDYKKRKRIKITV
jgi:U3 small nucleolar RNA-associated protein 12